MSKEVEFAPLQPPEVYHCLSQADYVAILAQTPAGLIPIVQQYRPAVEAYTWELPGGLLEPDESPEEACRRELREETGLHPRTITYLGSYYADTGRLENRLHAFFVQASDPDPAFVPEVRLSVALVSAQALRERILAGEFRHQLHLALLTLVSLRGLDAGY